MSSNPAQGSMLTVPMRFREHLAGRVGAVALAVQALEWCALGIPPALLARNPLAWHDLALLIAAFFGMAGVSATLSMLCPPRALSVRPVLVGCAVAAASAFLLVCHSHPPLLLVALLLGAAAMGWIQVQTVHLRVWLSTPTPPSGSTVWTWGTAIGGCFLAGFLASAITWTLPLWLAAWAILFTSMLLLRVPQPPLTTGRAPGSWRTPLLRIAWNARQFGHVHRKDARYLSILTLALMLQVVVPAAVILEQHATVLTALATLAGIQVAQLAGMGCSGIVRDIIARCTGRVPSRPLTIAGVVIALLLGVGVLTRHLPCFLLAAFLLGLMRAVTGHTLSALPARMSPLAYLATGAMLCLTVLSRQPLTPLAVGAVLLGVIIRCAEECSMSAGTTGRRRP
jgi:hypothetical protein